MQPYVPVHLGLTFAIFAAAIAPASDLPNPFRRFDVNDDNKITREEAPENVRDRIFPRFDANGDGFLDLAELRNVTGSSAKKRATTDGTPPSREPAVVETHGLVETMLALEYASGADYGDKHGKLDVYLPKGRSNFPFIVFYHGGGLTQGDKGALVHVANRFVMHGFGVAAVNYRLAPEVQYPAFVEDSSKALRYIYDFLPKWGGDRDRIYLSGGSAGGYLSISLTLNERHLKDVGLSQSNIRASAPISALMDVALAGPRLSVVWKDDPATIKDASPMTYVRADAPPMLIMFADGETEDRHSQNVRMYEALKAEGAKVRMKELRNRTHTTIRPNFSREGDPALAAMLDFLAENGAPSNPLRP